MANITQVTTPPSQNYDNSPKGNPTQINNTNIKNIVDPSKITRSDFRNDFEDPNSNLAPHYESNFGKFMQMVRNSPGLMDILPQMFFGRMEMLISSGIDTGFAAEISNYMEMLKMNPEEFTAFLKAQLESSVDFKGIFFSELRNILDSHGSVEFRNSMLVFLKKYNDMNSNERILNSISQNIKNIISSMPKSEASEIEALFKAFNTEAKPGDVSQNLTLLKGEIIPKVAQYISRYHDFGPVRNFVTLLTLDVSRYENSNKEEVLQALKNLSSFSSFRERFGTLDDVVLNTLLERLSAEKNSTNLPIIDKLTHIIQRGLEGDAGYENKLVFQNVTQSILINSSVYMPLLHVLIPAEMFGKFMFSEIWIDPNDKSKSNNEAEHAIKLLLKFDIENIGFFDMIVYMSGKELDIQLYYPEKLDKSQKIIQKNISDIVENNGLKFNSLQMAKVKKRLTINEVFPQILERRNNINVTI